MLALLDWDRIDRLLDGICAEHRGGRGYPPLCMLKALLLAQWYNLSDPALEDVVADRLSFRRFCGFPIDAETPDETSFVRTRATLRELGLYEKLFSEVDRQLDAKGLIVPAGALVDGTVIESRARPCLACARASSASSARARQAMGWARRATSAKRGSMPTT